MKLYGKKFAKRTVAKSIKRAAESRDGIIWQVDTDEHTCLVKIQGSNELVTATIPQNYRERPRWLKIGAAVRVQHRSGVRGYVEVTGEGRAIPSPVAGGTLPPTQPLGDAILEGLNMSQTVPPGRCVLISSGTYRIDNVIYYHEGGGSAEYYYMGTDSEVFGPMGSAFDEPMGVAYSEHCTDAPPSEGLYRYDAFVIGADGIVDYIKGTAASEYPVKPSIPGGHLLIDDYILVSWGDDYVNNEDIGRQWEVPYPTYIEFEGSCSEHMEFDELYKIYCAVVRDQYGGRISLPVDSNILTFTLITGGDTTGSLTDGSDDHNEVDSYAVAAVWGKACVEYKRRSSPLFPWLTQAPPVLLCEQRDLGLSGVCMLQLEDEEGELIING